MPREAFQAGSRLPRAGWHRWDSCRSAAGLPRRTRTYRTARAPDAMSRQSATANAEPPSQWCARGQGQAAGARAGQHEQHSAHTGECIQQMQMRENTRRSTQLPNARCNIHTFTHSNTLTQTHARTHSLTHLQKPPWRQATAARQLDVVFVEMAYNALDQRHIAREPGVVPANGRRGPTG